MIYEPESLWLITPEPGIVHPMFFQPDANRVYVDLGCAHPTNKSLTAFVRDLGWRGVAIDGNPDYQKDWIDAGYGSHFDRQILSSKPWARFVVHDNAFTSRLSDSVETDKPELWGIKGVIEHPVVPLEEILAKHQIEKIDLLVVDLEGAEFDVLQTLDFEKHSPAFIIAEYDTAGVGIDCRVCNWLLARGYEVVQMFPSNLVYRRK